ncbi:bifunctional glycosyltransferase family 2/GtrA family protein [Geomicrobium sp. JCM 19038]|uniref:bifunctional glycosyltransferase family 2/GtrA family protein n=1 Tax=Geomicrobium sp. JCM 19038 TaxID=1460635 RepID=UPI00045F1A45|nr:bifunctional glycosyltransferase family 2/GtrA family protein [Geomicrobium sp. JCM 19038]GAK07092.1 glycosyltransferase [Geomicrobium sp. JCM 19038]
MTGISVVIPAYEPDYKLIETVRKIAQYAFDEIIVVNDGSDSSKLSIFRELITIRNCTVLNHKQNLGKGRALKTAFSYFLGKGENSVGLVTADADGQHDPEDVYRVANCLSNNPNSLVLGVRNFSEDNIPLRSRFGNQLTKVVLKVASGISLRDTQTGLRGIPAEFAKELLEVEGERYEFEMRMLIACRTHNREVEQVTIETIYIDENASSHFNPIIDSLKIYYVFLRFAFVSISSFILDIGLFALFSSILKMFMPASFIIVATVMARAVSSLFNYLLNRQVVFQSKGKVSKSLLKYYSLAVIQMVASAGGVYIIYQGVGDYEVIIKVFVDSMLFLISFLIQRLWVFRK